MEFGSYLTGFVDGEGCFSVSFNLRSRFSTGIEVRPSFSVSQKKYSLDVLKRIQDYFHCGGIRYCSNDGTYKFEVRTLSDLTQKVIPHFKMYPLQTAKRFDFEKFEQICQMMKQNVHLNKKALASIIEIAYRMNLAGTRRNSKEKLLRLLTR